MARIKKVGLFSFTKLITIIMTIAGFIAGILYSFGGLLIDILVTLEVLDPVAAGTPGLSYGTVLAFGALIGMPLIFAAFGLVAGLIGAVLYNLFAPMFGGVDVDFESEK